MTDTPDADICCEWDVVSDDPADGGRCAGCAAELRDYPCVIVVAGTNDVVDPGPYLLDEADRLVDVHNQQDYSKRAGTRWQVRYLSTVVYGSTDH